MADTSAIESRLVHRADTEPPEVNSVDVQPVVNASRVVVARVVVTWAAVTWAAVTWVAVARVVVTSVLVTRVVVSLLELVPAEGPAAGAEVIVEVGDVTVLVPVRDEVVIDFDDLTGLVAVVVAAASLVSGGGGVVTASDAAPGAVVVARRIEPAALTIVGAVDPSGPAPAESTGESESEGIPTNDVGSVELANSTPAASAAFVASTATGWPTVAGASTTGTSPGEASPSGRASSALNTSLADRTG